MESKSIYKKLVQDIGHRRLQAVIAIAVLGSSGALYNYRKSQKRRKPSKEPSTLSDQYKSTSVKAKKKKASAERAQQQAAMKKMIRMMLRNGRTRLLGIMLLAAIRTGLTNTLAHLQGDLFRTSFLRQVNPFIRCLILNMSLCMCNSAVEATHNAALAYLSLKWRSLLTGNIHRDYFNNMNYYKLSYVNRMSTSPDQCICEDPKLLAEGLSEVTGDAIRALVDATWYTWSIRQTTGTWSYALGILGYILIAGTATSQISPNFGKLVKKRQGLEGAYRALHSRLHNSSESVALYRGTNTECNSLKASFDRLIHHMNRHTYTAWRFSVLQDFFLRYLGATWAVFLVIGPFFQGNLRPDNTMQGRADMLKNMRYHTSVVISLFQATGTLATLSKKVSRLSAFASRINTLQSSMKQSAPSPSLSPLARPSLSLNALPQDSLQPPSSDSVVFENADVVTPDDHLLIKDLNLTVKPGTNLLVTGPNGAGKSSLFRVLGGLWKLKSGRVLKPGDDGTDGLSQQTIFYVPQKPYVMHGSLLEQLTYPLDAVDEKGRALVTDEELKELLTAVDLQQLLTRHDPRTPADWPSELSLGEIQRLGMARLLYHKPKFAILDECTSGVTADMEQRFCNLVKKMGCTCITISHRPAMFAFHNMILALDGEGGYTLHSHNTDEDGDMDIGQGDARGTDAADCLNTMKVEATKKSGNEVGDGVIISCAPSLAGAELDTLRKQHQQYIAELRSKVQSNSKDQWRIMKNVVLPPGVKPVNQVGTVGIISLVIIARTLLQDRIARLNGSTVEYVLKQDRSSFRWLIGLSVLQSAGSAILAPSIKFASDLLAVTWRERLTRQLHATMLTPCVYYHLPALAGCTDADARITDDVASLTDELAALIPQMAKPILDLCWFSYHLTLLTGARGLGVAYVYMLMGLGTLRCVTPDFKTRAAIESSMEASFRGMHQYLVTHAEQVAFFAGGDVEGKMIDEQFKELIAQQSVTAGLRWWYNAVDDFFSKQLPHNVTWALTLMYSINNQAMIQQLSQQGQLVYEMRYLASVVMNAFSATGEILALPTRLTQIHGKMQRVAELGQLIQGIQDKYQKGRAVLYKGTSRNASKLSLTQGSEEVEGEDRITVTDMSLAVPNGSHVFARKLSFVIEQGHNILISGPNGAGKTSILRVLAGLWPQFGGSVSGVSGLGVTDQYDGGKLSGSTKCGVYYVSQKPYSTIGSLRAQVVYPHTVQEAEDLQQGSSRAAKRHALDSKIVQLFSAVKLAYLIDREKDGLDTVRDNWENVLSLGEQQRIGMARVFFHNPRFAVLDECTNATSADIEDNMYAYANSIGVTLITITQRSALYKWHSYELRLIDGEGDWELKQLNQTSS